MLRTFVNNSIPILFADNTSVLITTPRLEDLEKSIIESLKQLLRWFNSNLFSLNLKKTHFNHFKTRNAPLLDIQIGYHNNLITNIHHTKHPPIQE
jgi:hypothetical protein